MLQDGAVWGFRELLHWSTLCRKRETIDSCLTMTSKWAKQNGRQHFCLLQKLSFAKALILWTPCWIGPDSWMEWAWSSCKSKTPRRSKPTRRSIFWDAHVFFTRYFTIQFLSGTVAQPRFRWFHWIFRPTENYSLLLGGCFQTLHTCHDMSSFLDSQRDKLNAPENETTPHGLRIKSLQSKAHLMLKIERM